MVQNATFVQSAEKASLVQMISPDMFALTLERNHFPAPFAVKRLRSRSDCWNICARMRERKPSFVLCAEKPFQDTPALQRIIKRIAG